AAAGGGLVGRWAVKSGRGAPDCAPPPAGGEPDASPGGESGAGCPPGGEAGEGLAGAGEGEAPPAAGTPGAGGACGAGVVAEPSVESPAAAACEVSAPPAGPEMGRSVWRLTESPQVGQKRSWLPWMAAQRGQAVTPASRRTVTSRRSCREDSSARSARSICSTVASLASTRSS